MKKKLVIGCDDEGDGKLCAGASFVDGGDWVRVWWGFTNAMRCRWEDKICEWMNGRRRGMGMRFGEWAVWKEEVKVEVVPTSLVIRSATRNQKLKAERKERVLRKESKDGKADYMVRILYV